MIWIVIFHDIERTVDFDSSAGKKAKKRHDRCPKHI